MKHILFILLIIFPVRVFCQGELIITGTVSDIESKDRLIGATISAGTGTGTVSDTNGIFRLKLSAGEHTLCIQYLGYKTEYRSISAGQKDDLHLDILMKPTTTLMDEIVVSASKYEQKLSDVMVSMEVIPSKRIEHTNPVSLENIMSQVPGVEILDGQPSIRGGSGYSYGAGSRVMVLVDGLPMLTADAGDIKWDYLPIENIASVEVIKGASSVLYGSSALNGVFNIRSSYPTLHPSTSFSLYYGEYMEPKRKEMVWWDMPPVFAGMNFSHTRKIGNLDLVLGGSHYSDPGYRDLENQERGRISLGLTHHNPWIKGLSYGLNFSGMLVDKSDFLLWQNADSGAYRQPPGTVAPLTGNRFNIDPSINYSGKNGAMHSFSSRYFHVENVFNTDPDKNNASDLVYGEYRYYRKFADRIDWTFGLSASWSDIEAALYGNHSSLNNAVFTQLDGKISDRLKLSAGIRFERYRLDQQVEHSTPVFRTGLNYQLAAHSYLRASFGQAYRFPSVAEKYTATSVGSLNIFPNPELQSETGWNTEIGIKQGVKAGDWNGYLDFSLFWSEYQDMIEFIFGLYKPDSVKVPTFDHIGFKAINIGHTRIQGAEISLAGEGEITRDIGLSMMAGYTLIQPVDLNVPDTLSDASARYLKYRYRHSAKGDAELRYRKFALGLTLVYNSRMENIDAVFLDPFFGEMILPGFPDYWEKNNTGYTVVDSRILCDVLPNLNISLLVKNLFNREYMGRPGDIYPPRNITLKVSLNL